MMPHPRDELFLKTQKTIFLILAAVMTVMVSLISLGLSLYLLKPVKQLTEGTRAVARSEFDARLKIESRDELGQLAEDFNQMAETLESFEHQRRQWLLTFPTIWEPRSRCFVEKLRRCRMACGNCHRKG